jgi:hypothetical protein
VTPYFDLGFLLTLLVKSPGRRTAWEITNGFSPPYRLNFLQQFQVENGFVRQITAQKAEIQAIGTQGLRLWNQYLDEGVFHVTSEEWDTALRLALAWNRNLTRNVPATTLVLHPALASAAGATHFLSFQVESRQLARGAGLKLLPERL